MEDAIKIVSTKFNLSAEILNKVSLESEPIGSWMTVLGAYVLDNDRRQEEQKTNENHLRKQRLNAEHQLSQLEKQLISCNTKLTKYEKNLLDVKTKLEQREEYIGDIEKKYDDTKVENRKVSEEIAKMNQKYSHLEDEKIDFSEVLEKKDKEIERLNQEWNELSKKLAESNKKKLEFQYKLDEIKSSDVRKEFKEKRLEQENRMIQQNIDQLKNDLKERTSLASEFKKDNISKILELETKNNMLDQENTQLKKVLAVSKKTCKEQESKIEDMFSKMKRAAEEHVEAENNMQQELTSQTKLVQLYKDDRDHAKQKLDEVMGAVSELQNLVKTANEEKTSSESQLKAEIEQLNKTALELNDKIKHQSMELENANDLMQLSRKKGSGIVPEESISSLSPMAAASSAILRKGMTLTQIYTEYVKLSDELAAEKDENSRLKLYMEQILQEVEEKAPVLMRQKEEYEHAVKTVENMSSKMEENVRECQRMKNEHGELERNLNFHKREEKRLRNLCVDLSQQVRILLKEVEEARGGVVSSTSDQTKLLAEGDALNTSSAGAVISEHLVTFKSIEELQAQNERLLLTVRQLSEEQEKLEQEGGPEMIQELKKKIENATTDLQSLRETQKSQDEMMQQLARQRDMYKVLAQKGGVMVGDISSTSNLGNQTLEDVEGELTKTKAELDKTIGEHMKTKEDSVSKERKMQETISKQEEELSSFKLENDRLTNKLSFAEERHSILSTSSEGFKKEAKALEDKCKSINEAFVKTRVEAEKYKQDYNDAKEKLVSTEVVIKSLETEKNLVKEAEKRLMQENQSLLEQQRSQNVLLTNLQTIQNNLERQEFETRQTLSKQVENLTREMRALRRQNENEGSQLKLSANTLEKELKELKIKLGVEMEKNKTLQKEAMTAKKQAETLESKCKELEKLSEASDKRLQSILVDDSPNKAVSEHIHEVERYKTRVRELEMELSNLQHSKKTLEDQMNVIKKHIDQYKEIGEANEHAISELTKSKQAIQDKATKEIGELTNTLRSTKSQLTSVVAEKLQLKRSAETIEKSFQGKINDIKAQSAPLERRYQEVTRALVNAKELETAATKESQEQSKIAKDAQDKYERELVLHARDVEQLTMVKEELKKVQEKFTGMDDQLSSMTAGKKNSEKLMEQMRTHQQQELKKGEQVRKDLIAQNSILHGQVEKLSAQLAAAKSKDRNDDPQEQSGDKSLEEIYELLRFVRREKEISETKAEALETESMRYRQRAEHLQRDLDETKSALELEFERTKGRMLTEVEYKEMMEKVKKAKEYELLNKEMEKQKNIEMAKSKALLDKSRRLEEQLKPLVESKKTLENEKSSWFAEKTALKSEIDRWTARTNQLMAQTAKADAEEAKKLQQQKMQSDRANTALQDEIKRSKQQLEVLRSQSLKLRNDNNDQMNKISSLQTELASAQSNKGAPAATGSQTTVTKEVPSEAQQKELEESKKAVEQKTKELSDKNKMIAQLKKIGKRYKTESIKLQQLLKENNIAHQHIVTGSAASVPETDASAQQTPAAAPAALDPEEKKKLQGQIMEKINTINEITAKLTSLETLLEVEKQGKVENENKFKDTQQQYIEAEKKILELKKEQEKLTAQLNDEKEKQDKNKRFLKTAKDKIASLTKLKDNNVHEIEELKKQLQTVRSQLEVQRNSEGQSTNHKEELDQLNAQLAETKKVNEEFQKEKVALQSQIEQLKGELDARGVGKAVKRRSVSSSHDAPQEQPGATPLRATVRPTSNSEVPKHSQNTPTASIRPISHSAPTAMISPVTTLSQHPQQETTQPSASVQPFGSFRPAGRAGPRTTNVAPVQAFPSSSTDSQVPSTSSASDDAPTSSTRTNKRTHVDVDDNEMTVPDEDENNDGPGTKRQRVENAATNQETTDSQDAASEDDELLEGVNEEDTMEEGDDDVITTQQPPSSSGGTINPPPQQQASSASASREQRLQSERALIPSPQELMMRQRSQPRGRSQLPSFSLPSHTANAYYDEYADDGTVPSTPTLYIAKRTDGFAEAVSSPLVRVNTFSFTNDQTPSSSQTPALEQSGELVQATRMDLMGATDEPASVPQTPVSVVPTGPIESLSTSSRPLEGEQQAAYQNQQEEQNVPQQIDLTEDDDEDAGEEENAADEMDDEADEQVDEEEDDDMATGYEEGEGVPEDGIEIFAPDDVTEDIAEESDEESSSSSEEEEEEEGVEEEGDEEVAEGGDAEVEDEDSNEAVQEDEGEENEDVENQDDQEDGDEDEQVVVNVDDDEDCNQQNQNFGVYEGSLDNVDSGIQLDSASRTEQEDAQASEQGGERSKPVRLQRSAQGVRPRIRRDVLKGRSAKPEGSS